MNLHLLAIESLWIAVALGVGSFFLVMLFEAMIMFFFKMNVFRRCLRDSVMANIGSALLCFLLFLILNKVEFDYIQLFTVFFTASFLLESWIIKLLNKYLKWT